MDWEESSLPVSHYSNHCRSEYKRLPFSDDYPIREIDHESCWIESGVDDDADTFLSSRTHSFGWKGEVSNNFS